MPPPAVLYIGSTEVLPPPLTGEEEAALMDRLRRGDGSARTPLIERNLRLVVYIARKFENTGISVEDLVSIGTIGLIKADRKSTRLNSSHVKNSYAVLCLKNKSCTTIQSCC